MKTRKITFFVVLLVIAAIVCLSIFGLGPIKGAGEIRYGIDIRGGVDAVYEPVGLDRDPTQAELETARSIIETRLDAQNITDREVTIDMNSGDIIVRFPWKSDETEFDPEKAIAELGETALLTFRDPDGKVVLEGKHITKTEPQYDQSNNKYLVTFELDEEGAKLFADATERLVGKTLSIYMDETLIDAPGVNEAITGGKAEISGNFTPEEAKALSEKINAGSLPFSMTTRSNSTISPTLGQGALEVMVWAGLIAFLLICVFLIVNYRLMGVVSCIALALQLAGQFLALSVPQFTLTLPGIAGIILTLGIGVDANIIISERVREELRDGANIDRAISSGYHRAFSAVLDGNVTSAIIAIVLMIFGSGTMLSFGYTLLCGIVLNFVAGVFSTKLMIKSLTTFKIFRNPGWFNVAKPVKTLPFFKKRFVFFIISIAIMAVGLITSFVGGVRLDAQFVGGAMIKYTYTGDVDVNKLTTIADESNSRPVSAQVSTDIATGQKKLVVTVAGNNGITPEESSAITDAIQAAYPDAGFKVVETFMVEPYIGQKALNDSIIAIVISFAFIILYVWLRFRQIGGLSAGCMALIALFHDVCMVFFTFVFAGIALNDAFVAVTLTIIGYSVNDTIVIYDRIRENSRRQAKMPISDLVDMSISQSLGRSVKTMATTAIAIACVLVFAIIFGIESIRIFALPMLVGVICGGYSTLFIAGPLWVMWKQRKLKIKEQKKLADK